MSIKPLEDRVLIKTQEEEKKSEGGILLPGSSNNAETVVGEVIAVGPGTRTPQGELIPTGIETGSKVIFYKHAGTKIKSEGEEYVIVNASELLATLD